MREKKEEKGREIKGEEEVEEGKRNGEGEEGLKRERV